MLMIRLHQFNNKQRTSDGHAQYFALFPTVSEMTRLARSIKAQLRTPVDKLLIKSTTRRDQLHEHAYHSHTCSKIVDQILLLAYRRWAIANADADAEVGSVWLPARVPFRRGYGAVSQSPPQ